MADLHYFVSSIFGTSFWSILALSVIMRIGQLINKFLVLCQFLTTVNGLLQIAGYAIDDSCSFSVGAGTARTVLVDAIVSMQKLLITKIVPDGRQGTASQHGYSAFFKANRNRHQVLSLYERMVRGDQITNRCLVSSSQIIFQCVSQVPSVAADDRNARLCAQYWSGTTAFYTSDRPNIIVICPHFLRMRMLPQSKDCPFIRRNKMAGSLRLAENQVGVLIHKLAHLYGANPVQNMPCTDMMDPDIIIFPDEVYGMQQSAELPAEQQLTNAQNFALYAGCMFKSFTHLTADC